MPVKHTSNDSQGPIHMLRCPVCGTDKVLGEEGRYYCYDYEYEELRRRNGLVVPFRSFHKVHGPFEYDVVPLNLIC